MLDIPIVFGDETHLDSSHEHHSAWQYDIVGTSRDNWKVGVGSGHMNELTACLSVSDLQV